MHMGRSYQAKRENLEPCATKIKKQQHVLNHSKRSSISSGNKLIISVDQMQKQKCRKNFEFYTIAKKTHKTWNEI